MSFLPPFGLERFFARWEFAVRHSLCASDVEGMAMHDLLALADDETRALWQELRLGYTESAGHPLLRAEIARLYPGLAADSVLCLSGAEEGILLAMLALVEPGDRLVVVTPCYQSLHEVARSRGATIEEVPLDPARGWALDLARVEEALRPGARALVVNFPHSPTGALPTRAEFESLVHLAEQYGAWLFSDEVYRGLERVPADALPPAASLSPRAISLGVMSKSYALAGLRVGWVALQDDRLRARLAELRDYTTICGSAPSELLALIALRAGDQVLARSRALVGRMLPEVETTMAHLSEWIDWLPPRGGSVAFPRLRTGTADSLAERLAAEHGVLILPGSHFGMPAHFRIGFGRSDLPAGLRRFADAVPVLLARAPQGQR